MERRQAVFLHNARATARRRMAITSSAATAATQEPPKRLPQKRASGAQAPLGRARHAAPRLLARPVTLHPLPPENAQSLLQAESQPAADPWPACSSSPGAVTR